MLAHTLLSKQIFRMKNTKKNREVKKEINVLFFFQMLVLKTFHAQSKIDFDTKVFIMIDLTTVVRGKGAATTYNFLQGFFVCFF